MNKRLLFIYNPYSGKGAIKQKLSDIIDIYVKAGFDVSVYPTQSHGDATRKAIECAEDFDRIVCSGGDGTLNEVSKGLIKSGENTRVSLGYIPAGSTNDFGKSLGLTTNLVPAAHVSSEDYEKIVDIGQFNEDYFIYVAAFGIFTKVAYSTDQQLKNFFGHAAYVFEAIKSLQDIPNIHLKIESEEVNLEDDFIFGMVTNAIQVGGIRDFIKGDVELSDGLFEVMLIKSPKNPVELADIGTFLGNLKKKTQNVITFQTSSVKFISDQEVSWTLDGEFGGDVKLAHIKNNKESIKMIIKGDKPVVI